MFALSITSKGMRRYTKSAVYSVALQAFLSALITSSLDRCTAFVLQNGPKSRSASNFGFESTLHMTPIETMSTAVSEGLGRKVELVPASSQGASGGGGATTSAVKDKISGEKFFVKTARNKLDMLRAEYLGVKAMAESDTIQVPNPVAFGKHEQTGQAFCIFEYLEFGRFRPGH